MSPGIQRNLSVGTFVYLFTQWRTIKSSLSKEISLERELLLLLQINFKN